MAIKEPCGICQKSVAKTHKAIECDTCKKWIHIKCNYVSEQFYNSLIDENLNENITEDEKTKWVCINCINSNLPFSKLDQKSFFLNSQGIDSYELELENINFNLNKKDKEITNQITKLICENTDPDLGDNFCSYYDTNDFVKAKFDPSHFSIFHLNIASLSFHVDELLILFKLICYKFDCIMITETKFQKGYDPKIFLEDNFPNYDHFLHQPKQQKAVHYC